MPTVETEPGAPTGGVRRILGSPLAVAGIVASPLLLAAVLLTQRPWAPVLDMARARERGMA